jgi:hypothetical protein
MAGSSSTKRKHSETEDSDSSDSIVAVVPDHDFNSSHDHKKKAKIDDTGATVEQKDAKKTDDAHDDPYWNKTFNVMDHVIRSATRKAEYLKPWLRPIYPELSSSSGERNVVFVHVSSQDAVGSSYVVPASEWTYALYAFLDWKRPMGHMKDALLNGKEWSDIVSEWEQNKYEVRGSGYTPEPGTRIAGSFFVVEWS